MEELSNFEQKLRQDTLRNIIIREHARDNNIGIQEARLKHEPIKDDE